MSLHNFFRCALLLLLLPVCCPAQQPVTLWTKPVTRNLRADSSTDAPLTTALIAALKKGQLPAYDMWALMTGGQTPLTKIQLDEKLTPAADTQDLIDPVTHLHSVWQPPPLSSATAGGYRTYEDWTFNPADGHMTVAITHLAVTKRFYGVDGDYRGAGTVFGLKYGDVRRLPEVPGLDALTTRWWQSNFSILGLENRYGQAGILQTDATVTISMAVPYDTVARFLEDNGNIANLFQLIYERCGQGTLRMWAGRSPNENKQVSRADLFDMVLPKPDTVVMEDIRTGTTIMKIIRRDFKPEDVHTYKVLEHWVFNTRTGHADITINAVQPMLDVYNDTGLYTQKPLFWINYSDLQPVLQQYAQYHPENSMQLQIWNSFFLSAVKPAQL